MKLKAEVDLENGSSINFCPDYLTWSRVVSFFGNIIDVRFIYLMSYLNGLTLGTKRKSKSSGTANPTFNAQPIENFILPTGANSMSSYYKRYLSANNA